MKCNNCGFENEMESRFCVNCGNDLTLVPNSEILVCSNCGHKNRTGDNFCAGCGKNLINHEVQNSHHHADNNKKHSGKKHKSQFPGKSANSVANFHSGTKNKKNIHSLKRKPPSLKPLWITAGVIIVSILIAASFDLIFHKYPSRSSFQGEIKNSNPVIESQVASIASKFVCSCLTKECNETSLDVCTCDIAQGERQFIREKLEQNKKPDEIVVEVAKKFGVLKSEFASKYKVDPGEVLYSK